MGWHLRAAKHFRPGRLRRFIGGRVDFFRLGARRVGGEVHLPSVLFGTFFSFENTHDF